MVWNQDLKYSNEFAGQPPQLARAHTALRKVCRVAGVLYSSVTVKWPASLSESSEFVTKIGHLSEWPLI